MSSNAMKPIDGLCPGKVLISKSEIEAMVKRLGAEITRDYAGEEILLVCVLKGAFVFMADLLRAIDLPLETEFIATSSYGAGTRSSGVVRIIKDLDQDISGKHVIIVEDIIDTGLTLAKLSEMLSTRNPKSIELCTAFDKPSRRKTDIFVKYKGVSIPDEFIVGYGLDYSGQYRQLDEVYIMRDAKTDLE
ncbi:MAG: hypoxanthine phosphoribosyltransferase [Eubacteriales bacterium]|nr:hypoxanthine phosphoribosyltransferase [Eubacteriales bacterium]